MNLEEKILREVKQIKKGEFKSYKEIARLVRKQKAYRAVGNILAKNRDLKIPCHRVIRNDNLVGGYFGKQNLAWKKLALLLKEGVIAVMPTDTIYGICGSALNKKVVEKIYRLRKRDIRKPFIILISSLNELNIFGIRLSKESKKILEKIWPAKISVVLNIADKNKIKKFRYLHRGTNSLAFRIPKSKFLIKILKIAGPLVAPSANWEGYRPASTITKAKRYFKNKVVYYDGGEIISKPSTLIKLEKGVIKVIRKGKDFDEIRKIIEN